MVCLKHVKIYSISNTWIFYRCKKIEWISVLLSSLLSTIAVKKFKHKWWYTSQQWKSNYSLTTILTSMRKYLSRSWIHLLSIPNHRKEAFSGLLFYQAVLVLLHYFHQAVLVLVHQVVLSLHLSFPLFLPLSLPFSTPLLSPYLKIDPIVFYLRMYLD